MEAPAVSVVIPALNAGATIDAQLDGLSRQQHPADEVIVVDNGSSDDTQARARRWTDRVSGLRVVECSVRGVNRARNEGVRSAAGAHILICDADDVVDVAWIRVLTSSLQQWPVVGGRMDTTSLNPPSAATRRANPTKHGLPQFDGVTPYGLGANLAFRREVFDAIDGFDEAFMLGGDDIDFCWRAHHAGYPVHYAADAVVAYRFKTDARSFVRQYYRYAKGDAQMYAKHQRAGSLPARPPSAQAALYGRKLARAGRIWKAFSDEQRWDYARDVAKLAGATTGVVRYGVVA